jgi:hypothetical protein
MNDVTNILAWIASGDPAAGEKPDRWPDSMALYTVSSGGKGLSCRV